MPTFDIAPPARRLVLPLLVFAAAAGAGSAAAQDYPVKPVRISTAEAGSGSDLTARVIAQGLSPILKQPVVVENRAGASGGVAIIPVAKAAPDGYTLLVYNNGLWVLPLMQSMPWDPLRDFTPITLAVISPMILVVHPSLPVKSVKDLIALAKAKPRQLNYGASGSGGSAHLSAELFKAMAGVDIVRVGYRGSAGVITSLLSGEVQLAFGIPAPTVPHLASRRLRALAVTSEKPSPLFPGLPPVAAAGLPGYESVAMFGLFAPAQTPAAIIDRLHKEATRVLARPDVKEKFFNAGFETVGNSPEQFDAVLKADMARWGKVIKQAGIRAE